MSTHAKRERLILADLLESAARKLRPFARNGRPATWPRTWWCASAAADAAGGILLKPLAARLGRVQAEFTAKPYEELIQLIRTGPPRMSPYALKQVDEAANTIEFYIHAEDIRRATPDWTPRELDSVFQDALWKRLESSARIFGRKSPVGLVMRRPNGQTAVARKGTPVVTVSGEPNELVLYTSGASAWPAWRRRARRSPSPARTRRTWASEDRAGGAASVTRRHGGLGPSGTPRPPVPRRTVRPAATQRDCTSSIPSRR